MSETQDTKCVQHYYWGIGTTSDLSLATPEREIVRCDATKDSDTQA